MPLASAHVQSYPTLEGTQRMGEVGDQSRTGSDGTRVLRLAEEVREAAGGRAFDQRPQSLRRAEAHPRERASGALFPQHRSPVPSLAGTWVAAGGARRGLRRGRRTPRPSSDARLHDYGSDQLMLQGACWSAERLVSRIETGRIEGCCGGMRTC